MVPSKAAIAAFQFVEADLALSAAKKALRTAPQCTEADDGLVSTDPPLYDPGAYIIECWRLGDMDGCDACKVRAPLAVAVKKHTKARKVARLRAIRAVRKEVTR